MGVEQDGVCNPVAVFAKAADAHRQVQVRRIVDGAERNFARRTVLVAKDFLRVEEIDALVLTGIAAKGEPSAHLPEDGDDAVLVQAVGKEGRFRRLVIGILARFGTYIHDLAVFHDHHALAVIDDDDGAVGNDVVLGRRVGATSLARGPFPAFRHQDIGRHAFTIDELFPLIAQYAAGCTQCCFNQTHGIPPFCCLNLYDDGIFMTA